MTGARIGVRVDDDLGGPGQAPRLAELTCREREVLRLLAEGWANAAISDALCVSPKTLETHVRNVYLKLGLPDGPLWHRRVLAVRVWAEAGQGAPAPVPRAVRPGQDVTGATRPV